MSATQTQLPQTGTDWSFLSPNEVDPEAFGLTEVFSVMVKKHTEKIDARNFYHEGWRTVAELTDYDPQTGEHLAEATWFIFAATGPERGCAL